MSRRRAARTRSTRSSIWRSKTGSTSATCWRSSTSTRSCVADNLTDPGVLIALGDGGAHVDMLCDAGYPTYLLGTWVRERQIMTLEQAVAASDCAAGRPVRHQGARPACGRAGRRHRDLRSRRRSARRAAASAASTCRAAPSAWSCRRAASNTRSSTADRLRRGPCHRRDERNGAAVVTGWPSRRALDRAASAGYQRIVRGDLSRPACAPR